MVTSEYPHSGSGHKKNGHTAAWSPSIAASKHIFRALSNLDVGSDVPKEELDTVTDYIHQQIAFGAADEIWGLLFILGCFLFFLLFSFMVFCHFELFCLGWLLPL